MDILDTKKKRAMVEGKGRWSFCEWSVDGFPGKSERGRWISGQRTERGTYKGTMKRMDILGSAGGVPLEGEKIPEFRRGGGADVAGAGQWALPAQAFCNSAPALQNHKERALKSEAARTHLSPEKTFTGGTATFPAGREIFSGD